MGTPFSVPNPSQYCPAKEFPFPQRFTVQALIVLTESALGSRAPCIPSKAYVHVSGVTCQILPFGVDVGQPSNKAAYIYISNSQAMQFKRSYKSSCSITTYCASRAILQGGAVIALGVATLQSESLRELIRI